MQARNHPLALPIRPPCDPRRLREALAAAVGEDAVLTDDAALRAYDSDAYPLCHAQPQAVVLPQTTEQVAEAVRACRRLGVPFVPRGAGTGLSGGATPVCGGVVISVARMNRVLDLDPLNRLATVQPGCINAHITRAAQPHGLFFAPDPASQSVCTVGGNVAENSGGPHTLKYGVTTNHVLGLTVVLPDGEIVAMGGGLADSPGLDLVGLMSGAEGTLGIVTEVTVRLTPKPPAVRMLLGAFDTVEDATAAVTDIVAGAALPAALEMIDGNILRALEDAFHVTFSKGAAAVLFVELDGFEAGIDADAAEVQAVLQRNRARDVRFAATAEERERLWFARKNGTAAIGRLAPSMMTQDGVIPRSKVPEALREIGEIAARYRIFVCNIFHAGDGNLHPIMVFDENDPDELRRVLAASEEILRLCLRLDGSATGEHGVGIEKLEFLKRQFTPDDLACMATVKRALDPALLCNPGKAFPS